jgi:hypothetical protein
MDIRFNINRIDNLLKEKFQSVEIKEKSSKEFGNYFEISIKESKEVKLILPYKNIDNKINFEFYYFSNPMNESSDLIPRSSDVENINFVISDILNNNRFSEEYLKN